MKRLALLLLVSLTFSLLASATSITLQPTDTLEVTFTTLPNPDCSAGGGPCDTLIFSLGFTDDSNAASITSARLFDRSTLLGTFSTNQSCLQSGTCAALVPSFITPGSVYDLNSPVVDFSGILNGTIAGILDVRLNQPIQFDPTSLANFFGVTHAVDRGSGAGGYSRGYDSIAIITPKPSTLLTLGTGFGSVLALLRRKLLS